MVCPDCGKELKELFRLTEQESDNLQYAINRESLGNVVLNPKNLSKHDFKSTQELYSYIKNSLNILSEGLFLKENWKYNIKVNHNYDKNCDDIAVIDGIAYIHDFLGSMNE